MPVTITGDVPKRIEALVHNLSDENMRELTVQLRDSLVRRLWNVQWKGGPSVLIGRGLTAHSEPVRTPTGGWMCGVGSLEILHRDDAPPKTITEFLYWYQTQYMPAEKAKRAVERAEVARLEAKAKRIHRYPKEMGRLQNRLRHIQDVSIPHQWKLIVSIDDRIQTLRAQIWEHQITASSETLNRWGEQIRDLQVVRDRRRKKIRQLEDQAQGLRQQARELTIRYY
jgi:hypothetical protein